MPSQPCSSAAATLWSARPLDAPLPRQDAGFGWSFRHGRCGGYANRDCGAGSAAATAVVVPAAAGLHDTDMDEKRGDDDDVLSLTPLIDVVRKCSDMGEVVDHYSELPYPPRDPVDEKRRIVMDPNNTPIALSHHIWGGTKSFPKAGSSAPPFRMLMAGGGTGDATVMFGVAFLAAGIKYEIVHLDLSQASIDIAEARVSMHAGVAPNVRFIQGSLLEVASMGLGTFDFISKQAAIATHARAHTSLRRNQRALPQHRKSVSESL